MALLELLLPEFLFYFLLNTSFIIIISPFYMTIIKKIKAFSQRRYGPPLFQGYYNILKLLKKDLIYSNVSSIISRIAPLIVLIGTISASLSVPILFIPQYLSEFSNIILFLYLLAIVKFFMSLGGLDAGSTFGGMGSSREMTVLAIFEPIILVVFVALSFTFKTTEISTMFAISSTNCSQDQFILNASCLEFIPLLLPIVLSLFIILIVETARIPVDNPETHLELTMIHEAMILEQSGSNLAMLELSAAIKQTFLIAIIINLFFPVGLTSKLELLPIILSMILFFVKGLIICFAIGFFESSIAKFRLMRLPSLFGIAFFLPLITIAMIIIS
jgi:formate hydrogenlyase subunit 4